MAAVPQHHLAAAGEPDHVRFIIAPIATLQAFDQIYVMTHGGPFFQTETLVMLIYREGFQEFQIRLRLRDRVGAC